MSAVWFTKRSARRSLRKGVTRRWLRSTVAPCLLTLVGVTAVGAQTTRVSVATNGTQAAGGSSGAAMSGDGRYVAFGSSANNLVAGDTNGVGDVFVRDRLTGTTTRESVATGGGQATDYSGLPVLSGDGRFVAFHSAAPNLVAGDTNGFYDVFVRDRVLDQTTRVSVATGGGQTTADNYGPAMSADGRYVAFQSAATDLVTGDTNGMYDVFVHDRATATTTRVSVATGDGQATGDSFAAAISGDGRYVAFTSRAPDLVTGDTNGVLDVFMHDRVTGTTTRVSVATGGGETALGESSEPSLSTDGRYVAFTSWAENLVSGDNNGVSDVFVRDLVTGATTRVSVGTSGGQATGGDSEFPAVSGDGRYVTFSSAAPNLVVNDSNGQSDVFVHDRVTGATTRASVAAGGNATGESIDPAVSADGRYVAFYSNAAHLVAGDTNAAFDVFVHDTRMFQRRRVSVSTSGEQATGGSSFTPAVSANGRYVAFHSEAANLVEGDTNDRRDVFLHDRATGSTTRVSVATGGGQATGGSASTALSEDGRYVAFQSDASNLVSGDTNGFVDVFVHERESGTTTRVSVATSGGQTDGDSFAPVLSGDGRYVAFHSSATTLVTGDTNGYFDVFVHDLVTRETTRVNVATNGDQAMGANAYAGSVSEDGRYVAFESFAPNLVANDTNANGDIFVHDRVTGETTRASVATGGAQATGSSFEAAISADGRYVTFTSQATNLVAGDTNARTDVFVHDRVTGTTSRVSLATGGGQVDGDSSRPALSGDGRYVAFGSYAPNMVSGDTNGTSDAFVHDRVTGETVRASFGPGEVQATGVSDDPVLSADGRVVVYQSSATDLVAGDTNGRIDVFVRAATPVLTGLTPRSGSTAGGTTLRIEGVGFQPGTTAIVGGVPAPHVEATSSSELMVTTPPHAAGVTDITVTVHGFDEERLLSSYTYVTPPPPSSTSDTDGDGLPDAYEIHYGLDALDPSDASQDADGDGVSNAAEYGAGTHPTGFVTRYLAEGATSSFFRTTLALVNPGEADANVLLRFLPSVGSPIRHSLHVPPHSRQTIHVQDVPGLANAEFSTILESDRLVVLDRTMQWDVTGYGSHSETALPAQSTTWYLAEGATHNGFDLFYLLQNAASTETTVQVTFLRPAPLPPIVKSYTIAPQSRFNIWVDEVDPALANTDVSAQILASQPIVVERAMYLSKGGQQFTAGHQSAGVMAPALSWFLAEGATGSFFDLFVLLSNPNTSTANVTVTFLKPDGSTVLKTYAVAPQSRFNIWVDLEDPALANTAVSTTVQVDNGVPIVVERAMWWPGDSSTWQEAHNSPGATATGTAWVVASGEDGGSSNAESYVLIANTALVAATVDVTLLLEDGRTVTRQYAVPPQSRWNVAMREDFADAVGQQFGVMVESVGPDPAPVVVESAVYSNASGTVWAAGANALATKLRD